MFSIKKSLKASILMMSTFIAGCAHHCDINYHCSASTAHEQGIRDARACRPPDTDYAGVCCIEDRVHINNAYRRGYHFGTVYPCPHCE